LYQGCNIVKCKKIQETPRATTKPRSTPIIQQKLTKTKESYNKLPNIIENTENTEDLQ